MDAPQLTEHHARLAALVGSWRGTDTARMPDGTSARFAGRYEQHLDLGGWFLGVDYEQEADGAVRYRMRAVIGWSASESRYFMHWYDSYGGSSTELRGTWEGDTLVLAGPDALVGGLSRFAWRIAGDRFDLALDTSRDGGANWERRMDATYTRAAAPG